MNGRSFSPQTPVTRDNLAPVSRTYLEKVQNPKKGDNKTFRLRQDGHENEELDSIAGLSMN